MKKVRNILFFLILVSLLAQIYKISQVKKVKEQREIVNKNSDFSSDEN